MEIIKFSGNMTFSQDNNTNMFLGTIHLNIKPINCALIRLITGPLITGAIQFCATRPETRK